jgi:hypothetical protein
MDLKYSTEMQRTCSWYTMFFKAESSEKSNQHFHITILFLQTSEEAIPIM